MLAKYVCSVCLEEMYRVHFVFEVLDVCVGALGLCVCLCVFVCLCVRLCVFVGIQNSSSLQE